MGKFYQIHEVRESLSRLSPYTKVELISQGVMGGRVLQAGVLHAQRPGSTVCLRNQRMAQDTVVEGGTENLMSEMRRG